MSRFFDPLHPSIHLSRVAGASALTGAMAGLVVVAYRSAIHSLELIRDQRILARMGDFSWLGALWLALLVPCALLTAALAKRLPLIKGSGIPQVKAFMRGDVSFDWLRELPAKFAGGALALGAGLSLGREGPSIQLGALTGCAVADGLPSLRAKTTLVTAGAAAGISAAFNAPLAGVLFCIEELESDRKPETLLPVLFASFSANIVLWVFSGWDPVFNLPLVRVLPIGRAWIGIIPLGIVAGLISPLFVSGIVRGAALFSSLVPSARQRVIVAFLVAGGLVTMFPLLGGGGTNLVEAMSKARWSTLLIAAFLGSKFIFTLFSYGSGVPGGIFLPMLSLGALTGALVHSLLPGDSGAAIYFNNYLLLGMAALFSGVVGAPLTGAVLIAEMGRTPAHFPSFMFVSLISIFVAKLLGSEPIYEVLRIRPALENS